MRDEANPVTTLPRAKPTLAQQILTRDQLAALPEPMPLIEHTIDCGTVAVLAGYFGSLKSFIALDWSASIATGHAWNGRPVEPGAVLYLAGEGAYGLHKRISAWEIHHRTRILADTFHVLPRPVALLQPADMAELLSIVHAGRYKLVVIDTLAKSTTGMDENSAMDMGRAVTSLYDIQNATAGGTVLAIHHTGKDRTTIRGSSALESGVDTVYTTEGDAGSVTLSRTKRKDGPMADVHQVRFEPVDGTNSGLTVSDSEVIVTTDRARALLSLFVSHFGETGATSSTLRTTAGYPDATFYRALNDLVTAGQLANTGTKSRSFYQLATNVLPIGKTS